MKRNIRVSLTILVFCGGAWAQQAIEFGSVSGMIFDNYGDGLPDTTVVLSNPMLGVRRTMITTDDGLFNAAAVEPSRSYRLKVTRKGFADWESGDFQVALGQTLNFKINMRPAATSTHVEAVAVQQQMDQLKNGISFRIGSQQVEELPAPDLRLDPLVLLAPEANTEDASGQLAFHGVRSSNVFLTDGINTTNSFYPQKLGIASQLSQESVQEMQVLSSDFPAEFGRAMGGAVNAVTQSGSNNYHGAAYDYSRITGLTAHDRYAMGQSLLHRQSQAGASVGGPILHDKLFFFANFELLDGHFDGLNRISNPLIADGTGTQVLASDCAATAAQCAAASKFLQSQMNVLTPFSDRWLSGLAKINYRRSDRNTVALEANAMNSHAPDGTQLGLVAPNGGLLGLQNSSDHTRYGKAEWTSAPSAKSVNELRFGIFEDRWDDPASLANAATGNVAVSIAGTTVGASHPDGSLLSEHRYELVDNLTFTAGSHTLRFGGDLSKTRDWLDGLDDVTGTYVYPSLTAFAQDFGNTGTIRSYTSFVQQLGNPIGALSAKEADLYAQDTWRPFQRLLVTAGVRWEKPFYPQPPAANTTYYQTGAITSPDINFAPRMGLAYQLNNRTVIRAGYGWFYAPLPGELLDALYLGNGETVTSITVNPTQANAPVFPKTFASGSVIPSGTQNLIYASNKLRDPRTQQATLALERRLNKDTTLTLSVLNSRGLKFWSATDTNLATPSKTETYTIDNASGQKVGSFTTQLWTGKSDATKAHIYEIENSGSSTYNALALQLRKQISYGLSVQASYTWSHAIDDVSGPAIAGFVPLNTYDSNLQFDRGNSATDQRHRVAIDWMWQPTVKSDWAAARYLLNGWGISGIGTLASAEPVTPVVVVSGQQFSTITMDYTNSLNGSGGWARVPFEGINSLMTAPQYNVDVRVARTLPFSERVRGVLMFDVFNIFNTQHTTNVNTIAYQAVTSLPVGVVSGPYSGILKPAPGIGMGIGSQAFPNGTTARQCQVAFRVTF